MTIKNLKDATQLKLICSFISLYIISSVLDTPLSIKIILYLFSFSSLIYYLDLRSTFLSGFKDYFLYLIFILICLISFILIYDKNNQLPYFPQIENIIFLFLLFILLIKFQPHYVQLMNYLTKITAIFLLFSIPIHFFLYQSTFLTATSFINDVDNSFASTKNTFVVYLNIIISFAIFKFSKKKNTLNFLIIIIIALGIFYTFSRAGLILLALNLLLFFLSMNKNLILTTLIIGASFLFLLIIFQVTPSKYTELKTNTNIQIGGDYYETENINKTFTTESARVDYIVKSLNGFLERPIFGHGITSFRKNHPVFDVNGEYVRNPPTHNDYAQVLYEQGIIGILSFLSLFLFNFFRLIKNFSKNRDQVTILMIQLTILAIALNTINLLDHAIFWFIMAVTLLNNKKNTLN